MKTQRFHWRGSQATLTIGVVGLALLPLPAKAQAKGSERRAWQFVSGTGNLAYLGFGLARPLLTGGKYRLEQTGRGVDALAVSSLITLGLKRATHEERPDHSNHESFPSGHASAAFTIATMEAHYHHKEAPFWYLGAALIGVSRVRLQRHYTHDVLAGAALGYGIARLELSQPKGLLAAPFVHRDSTGRWVSFQVRF